MLTGDCGFELADSKWPVDWHSLLDEDFDVLGMVESPDPVSGEKDS